MDWKDIGRMVGNAAPVVGGLLLGPAGAAAGSILAGKLGVPATPDDIGRVLQGDPEALAKIKQIESEERIRFQELSTGLATATIQADIADRDSARKREMAVRDFTPTFLAGFITFGFFVTLLLIVIRGLPDSGPGHDAILVLLGTLGGAFTGVVSYYFGSSMSSARKTELLNKTTGSAP
jgi:hypothetical protein